MRSRSVIVIYDKQFTELKMLPDMLTTFSGMPWWPPWVQACSPAAWKPCQAAGSKKACSAMGSLQCLQVDRRPEEGSSVPIRNIAFQRFTEISGVDR